MLIQEFIRKDYKTVNPYQWVHSIKHDLASNTALVVMEEGNYVGLLTSRDIVIKSHNLVIDCLLPKPTITSNHILDDVLQIMNNENTEALSVVEDGLFNGIVYKNDLINQLYKIIENQQHHVRTIVHDLRNPIASISGLTQLLKGSIAEESTDLLEYTEKACSFANDIINELLIIAELEDKQSTLALEPIELYPFMIEVLQSINGLAKAKRISIKNLISGKISFSIHADRLKLHRCFFNLLSNAIKFTPEGGWVEIDAEITSNSVIISIADNGIGIPTSILPDIFEKFTKAKRQGTNQENSTGLGMYITKQVIELHKGKIWVTSAEKIGTTFSVELKTT